MDTTLKRRRLIFLAVVVALVAAGVWSILPKFSGNDEGFEHLPPQAQYERGLTALKSGDLETAQSALNGIDNEPDFKNQAAILRGGILLKTGNAVSALGEWNAIDDAPELRLDRLLFTAEAYYGLKDLVQAEQAVYAALKIDSNSVDARRWLAVIYYDLGADLAAEKQLKIVASLNPGDYAPYHLMGQINFDLEDYTKAADLLREALDRNPPAAPRAAVRQLLARALIKIRAFDDVLKLLVDDVGSASLMATAGEAHWGKGRIDRARQLLERAEKLEPANRLVLVLKARMAIEAGDPQIAVEPLVRQLKVDPFDIECRYRLALCYRQLGKTADYEREINRMREVQTSIEKLSKLTNLAIERPNDAQIREQIAGLFQKLGKLKMAEFYRRAAAACRQPVEKKS